MKSAFDLRRTKLANQTFLLELNKETERPQANLFAQPVDDLCIYDNKCDYHNR